MPRGETRLRLRAPRVLPGPGRLPANALKVDDVKTYLILQWPNEQEREMTGSPSRIYKNGQIQGHTSTRAARANACRGHGDLSVTPAFSREWPRPRLRAGKAGAPGPARARRRARPPAARPARRPRG